MAKKNKPNYQKMTLWAFFANIGVSTFIIVMILLTMTFQVYSSEDVELPKTQAIERAQELKPLQIAEKVAAEDGEQDDKIETVEELEGNFGFVTPLAEGHDGRFVLSLTKSNQPAKICLEEFRGTPATTTHMFNLGNFTMTVPYNPLWGSETFSLKTVESTPQGWGFGNIFQYSSGACTLVREMTLTISTITKSPSEAQKALMERKVGSAMLPTAQIINGLTTIKFAELPNSHWPNGVHSAVVYGEEKVYTVTDYGSSNFNRLDKIIQSIKF